MATNRLFIYDSIAKEAICIGKGYSNSWSTGIDYLDNWFDNHIEFTGNIDKTRFELKTEYELSNDVKITWGDNIKYNFIMKIINKLFK